MNELISAASVPKLAPTNYYPVIAMVKRLLNDSNFNVVVSAVKITKLLAKGLRKNFAGSAKLLASTILSKFKEKKTLLVDETHACLEAFFYCLIPEDVIEDLKEIFDDKNPVLKINVLSWIDKFVERNVSNPKLVQPLGK